MKVLFLSSCAVAGEAIAADIPVAVCSTSNERAVSTIVRVMLGDKVRCSSPVSNAHHVGRRLAAAKYLPGLVLKPHLSCGSQSILRRVVATLQLASLMSVASAQPAAWAGP